MFKVLYPFIYAGDEDPAPEVNPTPNPTAEEVLDIQKNYIKKEKYEELEGNYKKLITHILDGREIDNPSEDNQGPNASDLRKELYNPDNSLSNLEYVEKTLQLRKEIIKETGKDPFLPAGIKEKPSQADVDSAARVAEILQAAVDEADGDPEVFDIILSKKVI